jgi:hypothetical protein
MCRCAALHAGTTVAEALSSFEDEVDLNNNEREQLKSLVMSAVTQLYGGQTPAAATAAAAAGSASSIQAGTASAQQQQQQQKPPYPSPAALAAALRSTRSPEACKVSADEIVAFLSYTLGHKYAGDKQRQRQATELQRAALNVMAGLGNWELGLQAMAAGTLRALVSLELGGCSACS